MGRKSKPWADRFRVEPGARVKLSAIDPSDTGPFHGSGEAETEFEALIQEMADLQHKLYADSRHALLVVIQAMDAGGKDGLIRHVFSRVNPQGCRVKSFKAPSLEESSHDFLWRINRALPPHGSIGIFNRSHYEDVLIVRVHGLVPESEWRARYDQINEFEEYVTASRIHLLKLYLHISPDEQADRFLKRLRNPKKNWKFSLDDLRERARWNEYMAAYEDALRRCSTAAAPWHVIPSDHKWFRNVAAARLVVEALRSMPLRYPDPTPETRTLAEEAERTGTLPELPHGRAAARPRSTKKEKA